MLLWTRVPLPRAALLGRLPPTNCLCLGPMTAVMTFPSVKRVREFWLPGMWLLGGQRAVLLLLRVALDPAGLGFRFLCR